MVEAEQFLPPGLPFFRNPGKIFFDDEGYILQAAFQFGGKGIYNLFHRLFKEPSSPGKTFG